MINRYSVDDDERRSKAMSFKMKPSHYARLIKLSKKEDRTVTALIERAIVAYLTKYKV